MSETFQAQQRRIGLRPFLLTKPFPPLHLLPTQDALRIARLPGRGVAEYADNVPQLASPAEQSGLTRCHGILRQQS